MNTQQMFLASLLLFGFSSATAYTKVVRDPILAEPAPLVGQTSGTEPRSNDGQFSLQPIKAKPKKQRDIHAIILAPTLNRPSLGKFHYSKFNNKELIDFVPYQYNKDNLPENNPTAQPEYTHKIGLDYAIEYHYRPVNTFSVGLGFERVQVSSMDLDLRYNEFDSETNDYFQIATDTDFKNYYNPKKLGVRTYNYNILARAYVDPDSAYDPFFQFGIGFGHNKAAIHRHDESVYYTSSDKTWVWAVGGGGTFELSETASIEAALFFKNQHGFDFGDQLIMIDDPTKNLTLSASAEQYYTYNFRLAFKTTW